MLNLVEEMSDQFSKQVFFKTQLTYHLSMRKLTVLLPFFLKNSYNAYPSPPLPQSSTPDGSFLLFKNDYVDQNDYCIMKRNKNPSEAIDFQSGDQLWFAYCKHDSEDIDTAAKYKWKFLAETKQISNAFNQSWCW